MDFVASVLRTGRWINAAGFFRMSEITAFDSALRFIPALIAIPTVVVLVEDLLAVVFECAVFFGDNGSSISRVNVLSFFGPLSEAAAPTLAAKFARSVNSAEEELVRMIGRGGLNFEIERLSGSVSLPVLLLRLLLPLLLFSMI